MPAMKLALPSRPRLRETLRTQSAKVCYGLGGPALGAVTVR
jgi:hypothetical protein